MGVAFLWLCRQHNLPGMIFPSIHAMASQLTRVIHAVKRLPCVDWDHQLQHSACALFSLCMRTHDKFLTAFDGAPVLGGFAVE